MIDEIIGRIRKPGRLPNRVANLHHVSSTRQFFVSRLQRSRETALYVEKGREKIAGMGCQISSVKFKCYCVTIPDQKNADHIGNSNCARRTCGRVL